MRITSIDCFILHVPVTRQRIEDSVHRVSHWGAPGVIIHTDAGIDGYGYTGTHAHLASDRLITDCIEHCYAPLLIGEEAGNVQHLWQKLYHHPPLQWVGRSGITQLALSAVDIALWDIKAKASGVPLWKLLGGSASKQVEAYNTDGGWLNWTIEQLTEDVQRSIAAGYRGVKIKVGSSSPAEDLRRIEAVRTTIGPEIRLMVDANGRWQLPAGLAFGRHLEAFDIYWLEEPLWYDDLDGHRILARQLSTPIALGEQLYSLSRFRDFIAADAVHVVQADAVRLAGVTEWWQAADLALAHHLPVVPHIGDMMQVHLHLALAHRACSLLEYIPWLRHCFVEPATVADGFFVAPQLPGAGTTLTADALAQYDVLSA